MDTDKESRWGQNDTIPIETGDISRKDSDTVQGNPLTEGSSALKTVDPEKLGKISIISLLVVSFISISSAIVSGLLFMPWRDEIQYLTVGAVRPEVLWGAITFCVSIGTILLAGIPFLITSIKAFKQDKGKAYGKLGIITFIFTPVVAAVAFTILMW